MAPTKGLYSAIFVMAKYATLICMHMAKTSEALYLFLLFLLGQFIQTYTAGIPVPLCSRRTRFKANLISQLNGHEGPRGHLFSKHILYVIPGDKPHSKAYLEKKKEEFEALYQESLAGLRGEQISLARLVCIALAAISFASVLLFKLDYLH